MKISVIIPCFNAAQWLPDAVLSVVNQGVDDTEIVVVDDVSSDGTVQVAEQLGARFGNLKVVRQASNGGPARARNAGLKRASGRYVCFLDADDTYGEGVFAKALAVFEQRPWVEAVDFPVRLVNSHREVHARQQLAIESSLPSNVIIRRDLATTLGGFPESDLFRSRQAGEDVAFRYLIKLWGNTFRVENVFLNYTVRRGSHFDMYLDRTRVEGNQIAMLPDDTDALVEHGFLDALRRGADRVRSHFQVAATRDFQLRTVGVESRFETFDSDASFQRAHETLQGKIYPQLPVLPEVSSVLDIGANIGASAALFAHRYPSARIVAVEPSRKPYFLLRSNSRFNPRIESFNVGLVDETSGARQDDVQLVAAGEFVVKASILGPDIIKIDTGGHELPIVNAIADSFRNARAVYVEYHSEADRLAIDRMLCGTHLLFFGRVPSPHRGSLVYVRHDALPAKSRGSRSPAAGPHRAVSSIV